MRKTHALDQFTIDLTARARKGDVDPVLGRDAEIRQIIDILMRRRQNNPILTGEAGVGKTAVVEGFALRIVAGGGKAAAAQATQAAGPAAVLEAGAPAERAAALSAEDPQRRRSELSALALQLAALQGEHPLVRVCVDSQAIAEVVSGWTGIPVGRISLGLFR